MTGRGSWTARGGTFKGYYAYAIGFPMVGSQVRGRSDVDPDYMDYRAVWAGVKAIQQMINRWKPGTVVEDGTFGVLTGLAVRSYQSAYGLTADGEVGPKTATRLFRPLVTGAESAHGIPGRFLAGVLALESESFDPGAVGEVNEADGGLAQFHVDGSTTWWNTEFGAAEQVVTHELAFDPRWAIEQAARRMAYYRARYFGRGATLQDDCSIAQHNAPGWADAWFRSGVAPNQNIAAYVSAVRSRAAAY